MKTICLVATLLAALSLGVQAQTSTNSGQTSPIDQTGVPAPTAYQVVDRGPNHKVWQRESYEKLPSGRIVSHKHQYTELATGLNHQQNGQWVDSREEIDALSDGSAAATNGEHQAYFPADIYEGNIRMVTPDGQQLNSQPAALAYDDGTSTVVIAVLTNSVGQLLGTNQAIYADAFSGVQADVLYTYHKGGFEQDIVLRSQPPDPASLGLNPATTKLQVLTEFFDPPTPIQTPSVQDSEMGLSDFTLKFGRVAFGHGRAFLIGDTPSTHLAKPALQIPVFKSWLNLQGRTFLIEAVPYHRITTQLHMLPASASNTDPKKSKLYASHDVSGHYHLPGAHVFASGSGKIRLAKTGSLNETGFVLDYVQITSNETNFTFQGDTTYYVSGGYYLYGTTTIEGGTVIKMNGGGYIAIEAPNAILNCETSPYRPAVFTSYNDNSVGDAFGSGSPGFDDVGTFLYLDGTNPPLHDLRFSYCLMGVWEIISPSLLDLWNCQFVGVDSAVYGYNVGMHNVLISTPINDYDAAVFFEGSSFVGENITADQGYYFLEADGSTPTVALTNCLITDRPLLLTPATLLTNATVYIPTTSTPTYQTVGAGSYYLTNDSPYRAAGTTNISPELLAELAQKTTYPPLVYSNTTITTATSLSPQAQRDVGLNPDIGYHYDPLDYVFGNVTVRSNLTFTAGTAVAWFDASDYGMSLPNNVTVGFNGNATAPCVFALYSTVQEENDPGWTGYNPNWMGMAAIGSVDEPTNAPTVLPQFTHFYSLAQTHVFCRDYTIQLHFIAANCELYNGAIGGYGMWVCLTNCLADRMYMGVQADGCSPVTCAQISLQNCTMHGGLLLDSHWGTWPTAITNCAFDGTTFDMDASDNYCDYNAFVTNDARLPVLGAHDVLVTNFNWQTSWFGDFYLPTNSRLIDAGNPTANLLGLYHFTTQTNQTVEGDSIVDIGYHYVATDQYGNPLDSNGDGIPDYVEDANGDGLFDDGELVNWLSPVGGSGVMTFPNGFSVSIFEPKPKTQIP